ncbi:MAG: hypothetical protein Q4F41_20370 [Eubacteriales bacterium]|nr:hypothetical protein [Eubacteriales bacterium]
MEYANLVPVTGTILNISRGNDCCSQNLSLRAGSSIVNFTISPETRIPDNRQLRPGMAVTAFYDSRLPVPLIYPPQYRAQLIAVPGRNEQVMLNFFDRNLLAADRSLQLNIGRNTAIQTINGQNVTCRLGNQTLLVYYSATTRSLPPQTTPSKIVVLC